MKVNSIEKLEMGGMNPGKRHENFIDIFYLTKT